MYVLVWNLTNGVIQGGLPGDTVNPRIASTLSLVRVFEHHIKLF